MEPEVKIIGRYRWWPVVASLPPGWAFDELNASPLYGHSYAIRRGRSVLAGQWRILVRVIPESRLLAAASYRAVLGRADNGEHQADAAP